MTREIFSKRKKSLKKVVTDHRTATVDWIRYFTLQIQWRIHKKKPSLGGEQSATEQNIDPQILQLSEMEVVQK